VKLGEFTCEVAGLLLPEDDAGRHCCGGCDEVGNTERQKGRKSTLSCFELGRRKLTFLSKSFFIIIIIIIILYII